jgi:hypothetical protein
MIEPEQGAIITYVATMSLTTKTKPAPDGALTSSPKMAEDKKVTARNCHKAGVGKRFVMGSLPITGSPAKEPEAPVRPRAGASLMTQP